jgi:uncharacterized protein YheU (UPF0270 family)
MIDLEKMEKLARDCQHRGGADYSELEMSELATALLAVLPVVRAAMSRPGCIFPGCELEQAVDTLRRQMQEGE